MIQLLLAGSLLQMLPAFGRDKIPEEVKAAIERSNNAKTIASVQTKVSLSEAVVAGRIIRMISGSIVNHEVEVVESFTKALKPSDRIVVALQLNESTDYSLKKSMAHREMIMFLKAEYVNLKKTNRWRALSGPTDKEKFLEPTPKLLEDIRKAVATKKKEAVK